MTECGQFYRRGVRSLEKIGKRCSEVQSWALKESCFDYLISLIDLFFKLYSKSEKKMAVDFEDFKFVLAQCFQWYQSCMATIKQITETE